MFLNKQVLHYWLVSLIWPVLHQFTNDLHNFTDSTFQTQKPEKSDDSISIGAGGRRPSEKKKKVKMSDLRALIETKILSKSEKGIEKIGLDVLNGSNGKKLQHTVDI